MSPHFRRCGIVFAFGGLAGCVNDKLTANYETVPISPAFVAELRLGTRRVPDAFTGIPCLLNVDTDASPLGTARSGTPGGADYAVTVRSVRPINDAMNATTCPTISDMAITVGNSPAKAGLVVVADGMTYSSAAPGGFFTTRITAQNRNAGTMSAEFEAVAIAPASSSMIAAEGAFDIR